MLSHSDIAAEFERLLKAYPACLAAADSLVSPNQEDNRFTKMAIVGFSYHDRTENWAEGHYALARDYLNESESLENPTPIRLFSMLALGSLLGLYSAGKIDDGVYRVGVGVLPGFVMLHWKSVEELPE